MSDELGRLIAEKNQELAALREALEAADKSIDGWWAANWDRHYGRGITAGYVRAVSGELEAARAKIRVALAKSDPTKGTPNAK